MRKKIAEFIENNSETCTLILCIILAESIIIFLNEQKQQGLLKNEIHLKNQKLFSKPYID